MDQARVLAGAVADVGPAGAEVPEAPVLRTHDVADAPGRLVRHAVHGERRRHRVRDRLVQDDEAHGGADEAGQPLRDHAVEGLRLGDERPVAADLVEQGQVPGVGLRLLARPHHLVVHALEAEEGADLEDERRRVHGLGEEVVRAHLVPLADGGGLAEGRQHDDGQRGAVDLADPAYRARVDRYVGALES